VFTRPNFTKGGPGVPINRPGFASTDLKFAYLAFAVFLVFALLVLNLRRSTSGMALRAVRDSEAASRTLGLSVIQVKVIVGALGAFVAAVGGGFLALNFNVAQPQSYETFVGLIWLAVVVTLGVRSITGAAVAGLSFAVLPGIFQSYVPARWGEVPAVLFGLGAIGLARNPEGVIAQNARMIRLLVGNLVARWSRSGRPVAGVPGGGGAALIASVPPMPSDVTRAEVSK
jgi:branched-chain amino acid transport system permease protein